MRHAPNGIRVLAVLAAVMTFGAVSEAWALPGTGGRFTTKCKPSHTNNDDPIVSPGMPGASHRHQFFGARTTDAFSKPHNLRGGPTSCNRRADTAAYWVPTLKIEGRTVKPKLAIAYYGDGDLRRDKIKAFPPGLRMIAGRADATRPQPARKVTWYCLTPPTGAEDRSGLVGSSLFAVGHQSIPTTDPYCPQPGATLSLLIRFANCWDGRRLDSGNHRRHVAYSKRAPNGWYVRCPRSHPVPMPTIIFTVHYPTAGHRDSGKVELSAGGIHAAHADFMNAWDQPELERLVRNCINLSLC